jgi:UDP-N-acetylmuramyl pentapeptide phosphotransferase/UDP-N-acetylglucosamine-1-phosphate transferase
MRTYLALFILAMLFTLLITPRVRTLGRRTLAFGKQQDGRVVGSFQILGP